MVLDGFVPFLLDQVFPERCIICGAALASRGPVPLMVLPPHWPGEAIQFFGADLSVRLFPGIHVTARVLCLQCWLLLEPARPVACPDGENETARVRATRALCGPAGSSDAAVPLVSPFFTNDTLLEVVRYLKFAAGRRAVPPLSWWMAYALRRHLSQMPDGGAGDIIVTAVPLHPARMRKRGYNQAALLGTHMAKRLELPFFERLLVRTRNTRCQSHLSVERRAENVRGAFALHRGTCVEGRSVVLIDDLVTTGETVGACIRALRDAAPLSITVLAAGRVRGIRLRMPR